MILPERLRLLKWGDNPAVGGSVRVGMATLAAAAIWPQLGHGTVTLDFNHNTVPGHENYEGHKARTAGTGTPRVIAGDGLYLENIEWSEDGKTFSGHYKDISPTVKQDEAGEVIFLHSVALARNGAVHELRLNQLSASLAKTLEELGCLQRRKAPGAADAHGLRALGVTSLSLSEQNEEPGDLRSTLIRFFKLDHGVEDDEINEAIARFCDRLMEIREEAQNLTTLSAGAGDADREVMKRLGIDPATWQRHSGT
jgi:hypothetical protein